MANIMDYLDWRGDLSFSSAPFCEVDNIALSLLVYIDFRGIVPDPESPLAISLEDAAQRFFDKHGRGTAQTRVQKEVTALLEKLMASRRYRNCLLSRYINDIDANESVQFSAVTVKMENGDVYLAYKGTDGTMVGWRENFMLSYVNATKGQRLAVEYAESSGTHKKNLYIGGHSKGGNLALYAAMHMRQDLQDELLRVYNNDGPGFTEQMISPDGYDRILPKIQSIVPQMSVVGMLLDRREPIDVIHSSENGIYQHDAFSWDILGDSFIHVDALTDSSILLDNVTKTWLDAMDEEDRKTFVGTIFDYLTDANIETTGELGKLNPQRLYDFIRATKSLSDEGKDVCMKQFQSLIDTYGRQWLSKTAPRFSFERKQRNAAEQPT